jgi:hypothetical protein
MYQKGRDTRAAFARTSAREQELEARSGEEDKAPGPVLDR